jgi:hypothetical protein
MLAPGVALANGRPDGRTAAADGPAAPVTGSAQASSRVRIGDRGELIVDGKRRFILAGYRSGQVDDFAAALPSAAEAGFNLVHDYRFESIDTTRVGVEGYLREARAYLREADRLGLGVFLGLPRVAVRSGDEATLTTIISGLSGERALWMWYIYDEPKPRVLSIESASRVYGLLHRLDPQRPSIVTTNRDETMQQYYPYCDLLWVNRYPIAATSPERSSLWPIAQALEVAQSAVPRGKPVWPVVQAQDNKGSPKLREKRGRALERPNDRNHRPNESELRAQAHVAIAKNSMGVVYYWAPDTWYSMKTDTPGIWQSLGRVLRELRSLEPVLLSGVAPRPELAPSNDKVLAWSRSYAGQTYVGLVNTDINGSAQVGLRTTGGRPYRKVVGDGSVKVTNSGVEVHLGPAGVAVIATGEQ